MSYSDNVATQIATILENDGVGVFATDIFISKEPESPNDCITIYKTGGTPDDCLDVDERSSEVSNLQVRVRASKLTDAHDNMEEVRDSLEKRLVKLGDDYLRIWMTSLPVDLQRDTHNRAIVTANFSCMRWYDPS